MKSIQAKTESIIFDLDGTVIDSFDGIQSSFNYAYKQLYDKDYTFSIRSSVGPPIKEIFFNVSKETDLFKGDVFIKHFQEKYDSEYYKKSELYIGMMDLLLQLSEKGINLYIATNKRIFPTRLILDHLNIASSFKKIFSLDSTLPGFHNKTELVSYIIANEKLDPSNTILVGDTMHDQIAAKENGLQFIYAKYGFGELSQADHFIHHPLELINFIN